MKASSQSAHLVPDDGEGHVCRAFSSFGEDLGIRRDVGIVDVERELGIKRLLDHGQVGSLILGRTKVQDADGPKEPTSHLDLKRGQIRKVGPVTVQTEGLADADEQPGQGPGEACVVVPANENQKQEEGLRDFEIGRREEISFPKSLLKGEAILLKQGIFVGSQAQFYLLRQSVKNGSYTQQTNKPTWSSSREVMEA